MHALRAAKTQNNSRCVVAPLPAARAAMLLRGEGRAAARELLLLLRRNALEGACCASLPANMVCLCVCERMRARGACAIPLGES